MEKKINSGPVVLASVLTSYPDNSFKEMLEELMQDENIVIPNTLREKILGVLASEARLNDLRSEYISIFDHSKTLNPLYETEYGRERVMFKATELVDIAGFYKAFGFEMDNENGVREMVDHVSVELEFYSLLQMKLIYLAEVGDNQGCEIVADGMKKFLKSHLGRFVGAIASRPGVQASDFYSTVFNWTNQMLIEECEQMGVKPDVVSWLNSQPEEENVCCGGSVTINK